jgi:hypothetical protein
LPTLFGIYIDEMESYLHEHIHEGDGFLLYQVLISILFFINDLVLMAYTLEGQKTKIDALASFMTFKVDDQPR